jgi:hypothetical protein
MAEENQKGSQVEKQDARGRPRETSDKRTSGNSDKKK